MQLRDAAETLGVHYQTAYGWVRQGTLRARKTPRGYEVSEGDVRELMASRAAGAEPPREVQVRDWAAQADRLYTALAAGDEAQARQDFARLAAGSAAPRGVRPGHRPGAAPGGHGLGGRANCLSPPSTGRPRSASGSSPPASASRRAARAASP